MQPACANLQEVDVYAPTHRRRCCWGNDCRCVDASSCGLPYILARGSPERSQRTKITRSPQRSHAELVSTLVTSTAASRGREAFVCLYVSALHTTRSSASALSRPCPLSYVKNKAYMAGQTPFFGDFPANWPNFGAEALAVAEAAPLAHEDFC